jgi:hypothetical protein
MKRFFYYAVGAHYLQLAAISAASVRRRHADAWIAIAADQPVPASLFDEVRPLATPVDMLALKRGRLAWLASLEAERGLALDCDTYVAEDLTPLFDLLDLYDVACAYDARWLNVSTTPLGTYMNAGVVAFRRSERTARLWRDWLDGFNADPYCHAYGGLLRDQPALERALHTSGVRMFALPPEYNLRATESFVPICGRVRIIHAASPMIQGVIEPFSSFLNSTEEARCYFPDRREMLVREVSPAGDGRSVAIGMRTLRFDPVAEAQPFAVAAG